MRKILVKHGDMRTIEYFAIFPVTINREVRWLEKVKIQQKYIINWLDDEWWENERFVDD